VTVTFQAQMVPYVLFCLGPLLVLLGIFYTTVIFIRKQGKADDWSVWKTSLKKEVISVNALIAAVVSTGALFGAWYAQCYSNPTWGAPWPAIFVTLGTVTAAAAAATVPMGFTS
jgi:hypothetical protein